MAAAAQPSWLATYGPYVFGAVLLHALFAGLFGLTMVTMQRNAPEPTLAIQAVIVDQNQLAQPPRKAQQERERARQLEQQEAERKRQEAEANTQREQAQRAEQERQETLERQDQERVRQEQAVREREIQERLVQEKAAQEKVAQERAAEEQRAVERKRQEEAERQRKLEAERQAKAAAERKRVAEIERKQKEREAAEAKDRASREEALRNQLAEEEGVMQARASGAMNQYAAMIQQHVERQWIRPPSARSGLECEISVTQSPSGTVLRVQVGACNGDQAVKQSIENAVQRASPLPLPSDMRLFERNLRFIFKPAD